MSEISSLMNRHYCTNRLNAAKLNNKPKENNVKYRITWVKEEKTGKKWFIYVHGYKAVVPKQI